MKVQNQKTSNYKDEIQKENFIRRKTGNVYITGGKTLFTLFFFNYEFFLDLFFVE